MYPGNFEHNLIAKMRVLMLGWEFPPQITGGLGTACYGITKSLARQNLKILFVVPKAYGNEDRRFATIQGAGDIPSKYLGVNSTRFWGNVRIKEVNATLIPYSSPDDYENHSEKSNLAVNAMDDPEFTSFEPFSGGYGVNLWDEIVRYSFAVSLLARNENFDIIHAHDWMTFPAAISTKKISGKPLVLHIHATEFDRNGGDINREIYNTEKEGMELADKIITVSLYTRQIVIDKYGIHPDKVISIHNGIDKNNDHSGKRSGRGTDGKVVTFLGRLTYQKGPEYFIEAAQKVLQKQKNVKFIMAGSGDMKDKIVRKVNNLGIADQVSFPGFLNHDGINELFNRTDVFVMPSVSEPFGLSSLEALQCKVPVIMSKQSGVSEVIKNAIKVDYWDINALSDAIYGVLNYKTLSNLLSSKGGKEVNNLRWENTGKQILDIYKSLL